MLRAQVARSSPDELGGFTLRSREVSRVEGLSDAVFGFAITLLVVTLEVPETFAELTDSMRGFVAFGACFAVLIMVSAGTGDYRGIGPRDIGTRRYPRQGVRGADRGLTTPTDD